MAYTFIYIILEGIIHFCVLHESSVIKLSFARKLNIVILSRSMINCCLNNRNQPLLKIRFYVIWGRCKRRWGRWERRDKTSIGKCPWITLKSNDLLIKIFSWRLIVIAWQWSWWIERSQKIWLPAESIIKHWKLIMVVFTYILRCISASYWMN